MKILPKIDERQKFRNVIFTSKENDFKVLIQIYHSTNLFLPHRISMNGCFRWITLLFENI